MTNDTMTDVERVARALANSTGSGVCADDPVITPDSQPDTVPYWTEFVGQAETAIAALQSAAPVEDDVREALENLDLAEELIQEAKDADGPKGGFVTDHLDAAEMRLREVRALIERLSSTGGQGNG